MRDSEQQANPVATATATPGVQRRWAVAALGAGLALLTACGSGSTSSGGAANLRMLNASGGYASLDLAIDTVAANTGLMFGAVGAYASAVSTGVSTVVSATGSSAALSSITRTLSAGSHYTLVAYGPSGSLRTALISEEVAVAAANQASLQVMNLATDAGSLDVYLTGTNDALDSATANVSSVAAGSSAPYATVSSATYRLRVTGAGDKTDLRLDVQGLVLASTQVATLVLSQGSGGVLVNGVLLLQQGAATPLVNTQARVRVVAAVSNNGLVSATVGSVVVASAAQAPNISAYTQVLGSTQAPVTLSVNGAAVAVANQNLAVGGDYTVLVWGSAAAPQVTVLTDDNRFPTVSGNAKIRLINVTSGAPSAMTLKADFNAIASSIAQGQASAYGNVASSTSMRLDVSSATNANIYTLTPATIVAKGLYTMYLLGDSAAPVVDFRKDR